MAKKKEPKRNPVYEIGAISTVLGEETEFNGVLTFQKSLQINGVFEGLVHSEGNLVISEGARVKANLRAKVIIICGKVIGDVEASEKVELMETAELIGNIKTANLQIEDGAVFQGNCERVPPQTAVAATGV